MAEKHDGAEWSDRLTQGIGRRIAMLRKRCGLSAQGLSDRTADLGHQVNRSVIANLETGRRAVLPIADLLVLARALGTPPLALMVQLNGESEQEILPGTTVEPWTAATWITDEFSRTAVQMPTYAPNDDHPLDSDFSALSQSDALRMYRAHDFYIGEIYSLDRKAMTMQGDPGAVSYVSANEDPLIARAMSSAEIRGAYQRALLDLEKHRKEMMFRNLALPQLPGTITRLIEVVGSDSNIEIGDLSREQSRRS